MKERLICPTCNSPEIKEIAYGFPGADFDFDKYVVGGCCITDNDPKYLCKSCSKSW
jgi:transposase-like protein